MARLLSLPRRLAVLLFTFLFSIVQFVRAKPTEEVRRGQREGNARYEIDRALLLRLAGKDSKASGRNYALRATGSFPYVRLEPVSIGGAVPVPMLLPRVPRASLGKRPTGLLHAAIGGLFETKNAARRPPNLCHCSCTSCGGCGSCGSCASCSSCSSCSCTSCGTSCGGSSCVSSCGVNSCATSCSLSCGTGFGSCGYTSCGNCLSCASCVSCMSCTSCVCTSCASCNNCGSCASCVG
jgi:hypothetical protein